MNVNVRQLARFLDNCSDDESFYDVLVDGEPLASAEFDYETKTVKLWR